MKKLSFLLTLILPFFVSAQITEGEPKKETEPKAEILTFSETMPEFPGGTQALYEFISKEMKYPKNLKKDKIEARVISRFVINKEGYVENIQIVNKVEQEFAEETVRVLSKMPQWKPGMQAGKPVNVIFTLPISFKLK